MLVYEIKTSKKGNEYPVIYWLFKSGKKYRLNLPFIVANSLVKDGYAECLRG